MNGLSDADFLALKPPADAPPAAAARSAGAPASLSDADFMALKPAPSATSDDTAVTEFGDIVRQPPPSPPGPQSQAEAYLNAPLKGAVSGTGALVAGAGRLAQAGQGPSAQRVLAAFDLVDQGKTRQAYLGLTDSERQQVGAYRGAGGDDQTAQRQALQQTIVDYAHPNAAMRTGAEIEAAARGMFPIEPQNKGHITNALEMAGGAAPALLASAATGPLGAMAIIGSQAYDGAYQDAISKGATHEQADDAAGKTALTQAALMAVPVSRVLQRIPVPFRDGLAKTLVNLGQNGVEFGTANALGTFASNYVASQTYDPGRP